MTECKTWSFERCRERESCGVGLRGSVSQLLFWFVLIFAPVNLFLALQEWNFDDLLEKIWLYLNMLRMYAVGEGGWRVLCKIDLALCFRSSAWFPLMSLCMVQLHKTQRPDSRLRGSRHSTDYQKHSRTVLRPNPQVTARSIQVRAHGEVVVAQSGSGLVVPREAEA